MGLVNVRGTIIGIILKLNTLEKEKKKRNSGNSKGGKLGKYKGVQSERTTPRKTVKAVY